MGEEEVEDKEKFKFSFEFVNLDGLLDIQVAVNIQVQKAGEQPILEIRNLEPLALDH